MFYRLYYASKFEEVCDRIVNQFCWTAKAIERAYYALEIRWRIRAVIRNVRRVDGMAKFFDTLVPHGEHNVGCHRLWQQPYYEAGRVSRVISVYITYTGQLLRQIEPPARDTDLAYLSLRDKRLPAPVLIKILKGLRGAQRRAQDLVREHDWEDGARIHF